MDTKAAAQACIDQSNTVYSQCRLDNAIPNYTQVNEKELSCIDNYISRGLALSAQGKLSEAIEEYARATEAKPSFSEAYCNWGDSLRRLGRYEEAIQKFERAIELDPNYSLTYNNLGLTLSAQGKYDEAIQNFSKAVDINPNYCKAYLEWGHALEAQGEYDEAITKYAKMTSLDPNYKSLTQSLSSRMIKVKIPLMSRNNWTCPYGLVHGWAHLTLMELSNLGILTYDLYGDSNQCTNIRIVDQKLLDDITVLENEATDIITSFKNAKDRTEFERIMLDKSLMKYEQRKNLLFSGIYDQNNVMKVLTRLLGHSRKDILEPAKFIHYRLAFSNLGLLVFFRTPFNRIVDLNSALYDIYDMEGIITKKS